MVSVLWQWWGGDKRTESEALVLVKELSITLWDVEHQPQHALRDRDAKSVSCGFRDSSSWSRVYATKAADHHMCMIFCFSWRTGRIVNCWDIFVDFLEVPARLELHCFCLAHTGCMKTCSWYVSVKSLYELGGKV